MAEMPWFKFYPSDWLGTGLLRLAPHAVKGFYIDLLCIMFDCENRGRLEAGGIPLTEEEIAGAINGNPDENLAHLRWLTFKGVLSKDEQGVIYSRRMVKDEAKRKSGSEAGKKGGGNPDLTKGSSDSQTYIGKSKGRPKGSREKPIYLETRDQRLDTRNETPSSPTPPDEAREEGGEGNANWIPSGWQAMEIRLRELGMLQAGEAVDWCRGQGLAPEDVARIVDYWATKPVGYWPSMVGALHHKLTHLIEGEPFDSAFPAPAPKFQQREANGQAAQQRQEARQRESAAKSETQAGRTCERELEATYGPQLDSMDDEERERIIAEVCPQETARSLFRRGWQRPASLHRTKLLKFLAEMKVPIEF